MSQYLVNGAQYAISTVRGLAVAIDSITNASPAVATATSAPAAGSVIVVESGWAGLNGKPVYVQNVSGTTFSLAGTDTSDTDKYVEGLSAGSYRVMSSFVSLDQITGIELSGGDSNSVDWTYVEDPTGDAQSMPTNKNALSLTFTQHEDPTKAWYSALQTIDTAKTPIVMRETLPSGRVNLFAGYASFQPFAGREANNILTCSTVIRVNKWTAYDSEDAGS